MEIDNPIENKYTGDNAYTRLDRLLIANNEPMIGLVGWREKQEGRFKIVSGENAGELRPASLDLEKDSRIARTIRIKKFTKSGLEAVHEWEKKHGKFLDTIQMFYINHEACKPTKLTQPIKTAVEQFQFEHRPQCGKYKGVIVPPYHINDCFFDGLEYMHEWDNLLWFADFHIPEEKSLSSKF